MLKFGAGGLVGATIGALSAALFAPQSGPELQAKVSDRIREAKIARDEAQAAKESELIARFRHEVNDPDALVEEQAESQITTASRLSAIGLGLNAPGALAAQQTTLRTTEEK
jgi:gas vesicle protein